MDSCPSSTRTKTRQPAINIEAARFDRLRDVASDCLGRHGGEGAICHAARRARSCRRTGTSGGHGETTLSGVGGLVIGGLDPLGAVGGRGLPG